MLQVALFTAVVLDKTLAFLAPLFLDKPDGDVAAARWVASQTLASYGARTDRELRFAALIVVFSFGALDAMGQSVNPALTMNQALRLRSNGAALSRAAHQNEARLRALQAQPAVETRHEVEPPLEVMPASIATQDLVAFTRSAAKPAIAHAAPVAPLSRQQRRLAERQAEKVRLRQQEEARRAQRTIERAGRDFALAGGSIQRPGSILAA